MPGVTARYEDAPQELRERRWFFGFSGLLKSKRFSAAQPKVCTLDSAAECD
jgi:hypothetical protein